MHMYVCVCFHGEEYLPKFRLKPQWTQSGILKVVQLNTVIKTGVYKYYKAHLAFKGEAWFKSALSALSLNLDNLLPDLTA